MGKNNENENVHVERQDNTQVRIPITFTPQGLPQNLYIGTTKSDPILPFSKPSEFEQFIINNYSKALNLLDEYDYRSISRPNGTKNNNKITYEDCIGIISKLKFNNNSNLFAIERNEFFEGKLIIMF